MTATSATRSTEQSQRAHYQHYIPQFILRNFSYPHRPENVQAKTQQRRKKKDKTRIYPGDPMLHTVDLTEESPKLVEAQVNRAFGLDDGQRNLAPPNNQQQLEKALARLESDTGAVITRIRRAYESGDHIVSITRAQKDTLRKFLFIMKYRGYTQRKRYYHQTIEEYSANDKASMIQYMHQKGFRRPVDVWFDNMQAILETEMDMRGDWMDRLRRRIYPDDADWVITHMTHMYLALCAPSDPSEEFLLSGNVFGIQEGPVSQHINPLTGEMTSSVYTEFHILAAITPKLMMVLRSDYLPIPEEDVNKEVKAWRENMFQLNAMQHNKPAAVRSFLTDLPVTKPRNSYTRVVNGRTVLLPNENGTARPTHQFYYRFFPVPSELVQKINTVVLEESYNSPKVMYKSQKAARKALEYYL
ncbi:hypothetical protein AOQ84DRAFT_347063, partial [Glonium stellatum]